MATTTRDAALHASILDTAPDAVLAVDDRGRVTAVNRTAEGLFGRPAGRLAGMPIDDLIGVPHHEDAERARRSTSVFDEPEVALCRRFESFGVRADGTRFPADVILTRTGGEPPVTAWVRDLSGDTGGHAAAVRRKALLERAEQIARIGSWQWDPQTSEFIWSDELYRIFGYEPGTVVPSIPLVLRHVHPDDVPRWRRAVEHLGRAYTLPPLDYRITRADGALRHLRVTMAAVEESPGGARTIVGSTQDVTEQHRAERQIAAHLAVADALAEWDSPEDGPTGLLRDLGRAMDSVIGALWIPSGETLRAVATWHDPGFEDPEFDSLMRRTGYARGTGLPGRAWSRREPVHVVDVTAEPGADRRFPSAAAAGLRGALALPAIDRGEVVAVLELLSREPAEPNDRLLRSLTGIGYEIGQFLARRRGELHPPALSPREVEVLQLAAEGHAGRSIAEQLVVSPATVKTHFEHIYAKLGVPDRASAVAEALRLGLIR